METDDPVDGTNHEAVWRGPLAEDPLRRLEFNRPHDRLCVSSEMRVEVHERRATASQTEAWERARNRLLYTARPPGELPVTNG